MIFIANALPVNGGTTFLIRMCQELFSRNKKATVLVLFDEVDEKMHADLVRYADVVFLKEYSSRFISIFFKNQIGSFLPLNFSSIDNLIDSHKREVHILGIFGLLFVERLIKKTKKPINYSVGIYHQNEFVFSGADFYFSNKAREIFSRIDPKKIIFFNETSKEAYEKFFGKKYDFSRILPIGIKFNDNLNFLSGKFNSKKIVSIGNLYRFKTYNKHVIALMPELLKIKPGLVYEIYGKGPYESELKSLAVELNVAEFVKFQGSIEYEKMNNALNGALFFIGSGTAIIEAAALGIPSIIGIESIQTPETYGFFGDVQDLSYNEFSEKKPLVSIFDTACSIINNFDAWNSQSKKSKIKSREFSIEKTVDGFIEVFEVKTNKSNDESVIYSNLRSFFSFLYCSFLHLLKVNRKFSNRRNQGTL